MNTTSTFYVLLAILGITYGLIYFGIGLLASRSIKSKTDYFLAGKGIGVWFLTATLTATQVGGGMLLGTAAESYQSGFYGILYSLGMCLGFLLLGCGFAAKLRSLEVSTTAELFEKKFGSMTLKKVASSLSMLSLCGVLAAQFVGLKGILAAIGVNQEWISICLWMMIVGCTMAGGLKAVVATDAWQLSFILLTFGGLFTYALVNQEESSVNALTTMQSSFTSNEMDTNRLLGILLVPAFFCLIEQDVAQRFFSARSKRVAIVSALFSSGLVLLFSFVPVYFGMKAKLLGLSLEGNANPLLVVVDALTNPAVLAIAVIAIIAAITSTADSLLCAVSSNLSQDFQLPFLSGKHSLIGSRLVTLGIGILALLIGCFFNNIIDVMIQSYELMISAVLIPIMCCLFIDKPKKNAAILSMALGFVGFIVFRFIPLPLPREIASLLLSTIGYMIGSGFGSVRLPFRKSQPEILFENSQAE
jgi:SSS family solute:Na+ symporter